jgi:hypothetical protein
MGRPRSPLIFWVKMEPPQPALSSFRFKRTKTAGLVEVLNDRSYVMAEYSERTGVVKWQRLVLAGVRAKIEKWLYDHYPVLP